MPSQPLFTRSKWLPLLFFLGLSFLVFGNGLGGQFVYDDSWVITRNPTLTSVSGVFSQFISPYHYLQPETGLYRPLTLISYSLNFIFSLETWIFHFTNILLHALAVWLMFLLILEIFKSKRLAYLTSVLFLLFPIHVEAVTSIVGRADLLAFVFSLIAIFFVVKKKYALSSAVWLLALLSKESSVASIVIIIFYLWAFERMKIKQLARKVLYFIPTGMVYLLLRYIALRENFLANDASYIYNPLKFTDLWTRVFTALKIMTLYLSKTLAPLNLSADYSFNQIPLVHSLWRFEVLLGLSLILFFILFLFFKKTRQTPWSLGAIIFLASYFVISNFVFPIGTLMAERTFYFPSFGLALMLACSIDYLMRRRLVPLEVSLAPLARVRRTSARLLLTGWLALFAGVGLIYGVVIFNRNKVWADADTLYRNMVVTAPQSAHVKTNLGNFLIKNSQWQEGKEWLEKAYTVAPEHLPLLDGLGLVAEHDKRYQDAESFYKKAIAIRPHYATALSNLGRMYFQLGRYEKSAEVYWQEFTYKSEPGPMLVYAMSKTKSGHSDEAIAAINKYFGDNPKDIRLRFALGYAYFKKGDRAIADQYFKTSKNPNISDEEFIKSIEKF